MEFKTTSEIMSEIAERARSCRRASKLSQEELAKRSGVSWGSVKRFESSGKISLESLLKIAVVLDQLNAFEGLFLPSPTSNLSLDEILSR